MQMIMLRHRVANFETWYEPFSKHAGARKENGIRGHRLARDASDGNLVTCILYVSDLTRAKALLSAPEMHQAMAAAGVQGTPEVVFLDSIEERSY